MQRGLLWTDECKVRTGDSGFCGITEKVACFCVDKKIDKTCVYHMSFFVGH